MKVCTNFYTVVTNRIFYVLIIVNMKILRNNINNLIACGNKSFAVVFYKLINFAAFNFNVRILTDNIAACLQTFYVMPCNTNIYIFNFKIRIAFGAACQRLLNSFNGLVNIQHLPMLYAVAIGATKPKNIEFAVFIFSAGNCSNFCC